MDSAEPRYVRATQPEFVLNAEANATAFYFFTGPINR